MDSYTTRVGHEHRQSGWQGNARTNLSAISQEMPSGSLIRLAAVCSVFLAELFCASCKQFNVPDETDSALATHTAAGHTPDSGTHVLACTHFSHAHTL